MNLSSHVDLNVLSEYKTRHLLRSQSHPQFPLTIWNYTERVKEWDHVTLRCRGLIVENTTGRVVGHSFPKFFNDHAMKHEPTPLFDVFEKLDGSLGILFHYENQWIFTSRGSFISDQAKHAQSKLQSNYDLSLLDTEVSYVVEIIYPTNRIVVDYKDRDDLVILAAYKKPSKEFNEWKEIYPITNGSFAHHIRQAGFSIVQSFDNTLSLKHLQRLNQDNAEGFVVRFDNGQRIKIKFENYKQLHRVLSHLNVGTLFESFQNQKSLTEVLVLVPKDFHNWIREVWLDFDSQLQNLKQELSVAMIQIMKGRTHDQITQRDFALIFKDHSMCKEAFVVRKGDDKGHLHIMLCKRIVLKDNPVRSNTR